MTTPAEMAERGLKLYEVRNRIARIVYRLPFDDLVRLANLLESLSDDDMRSVARFAEGLADWPIPESHSSDAAKEADPA